MRALLERSRSARVLVAGVAGCCVLALVNAASAANRLDMFEVFRLPAPAAAPAPVSAPEARRAVSIRPPAARPLRIALDRTRHNARRVAERSKPLSKVAAHRAPTDIRVAALPPTRDSLFAPMPQKPVIVSIYEDQTLRRGDAVMLRDGLHVFSGREAGQHRASDFVQLAHALSLEWHLRKTLSAFEYNPPDHWRS